MFNENSRVKIPALLHLIKLGYTYLPLQGANIDPKTNIFTDIFSESISRINNDLDTGEVKKMYEEVSLSLENDDLGQVFYKLLTNESGNKLIDFQNFDNNSFHVVTELPYKNGEDEFRPDITLLINGMPLAFVEVKIPNNRQGILAERERINIRFQNKKFRNFINISQIIVFSNNMNYDSDSIEPIQGAFYATGSYEKANFNCFREEYQHELDAELRECTDDTENLVLKDTNLFSIKHSPEFITNKEISTPTNRILTSLFNKKRLKMILKYAFAYVKSETGLEKHIMRYPQLFATYAIEKKLEEGNKNGIIWHTQGSGKTALTFYNVQYLTDYFQRKGVIPKFYFIVDRIDLMNQAKGEFSSRGLVVHTVDSREELLEDFKTQKVINNFSGKPEITVVNIQKFKDDPDLLRSTAYDLNIQRIYFLDEVHRSYKEEGSFLANLYTSDRSAILIGLTGTPLIGKDRKSRDTFGDYIHKYYYNDSIADGYTLKLIREGIESNYRIQLDKILNEIEVLKGDVDRKEIYAHERFVEPMLEYIVDDLTKSRIRFGDKTIGGMVICDSSEQAKKMYELFQSKYVKNGLTASVILHDIGDKDTRKEEVDKFKEGKIDLLFVYEMLLTGFDAKRLKKLYIGRIIRDHNLLQALTRVNRPYKDFRYGYVVDFADIRREFDKTNRAYFDELQLELGDEIKTYSNIFKSEEEIEKEIEEIKETLFQYDISNAEVFSQQISQIEDKKEILLLKKALENVNNLYNAIRLYGHVDLLDRIDFKKLHSLYGEASRRLDLLNLKESLEKGTSTTNLLNVALENVLFQFRKVSENELVIADKLKDILRKAREELGRNFDKQDPMFVTLYEELKRLFEKKNLDEISQGEMEENIKELRSIFDKATELNRKNNLLKAKYENDAKYARLHKKIMSDTTMPKKESHVHEVLVKIKESVDEKVLVNTNLLRNEDYFTQMTMQIVADSFGKSDIGIDTESLKNINSALAKEYMNEYGGMYA